MTCGWADSPFERSSTRYECAVEAKTVHAGPAIVTVPTPEPPMAPVAPSVKAAVQLVAPAPSAGLESLRDSPETLSAAAKEPAG